MAIATATALAIGGIASSAGGAIMSFNQAAKQNRLMTQAEQDAMNAMAQARGLLQKNYAAGLSIQKEPYELEREALLSAGAQSIQAGVESERGAAATAGRIQGQMNEAQQEQRKAMQKELATLEEKTADEASRLRDMDASLYLEEAAGQQKAARDAAEAKAAAIKSGMASATSAIQQGVQAFVPLYPKDRSINPETGFKKGSTEDMASTLGKTMPTRPSTIGMIPGANNPMLLKKNINTPAPQNPFIFEDQPAYTPNMYNPFNIFG